MSDEDETRNDATSDQEEKSTWERVVAALSTILVVSVLGFTVYDGMSAPSYSPPLVEVTVDTIVAMEKGFLVEFTARNGGHSTAAGLVVEGELSGDTGRVETAETTLPFVPGGATRHGGLYFSADPRSFALEVRPKGFGRP